MFPVLFSEFNIRHLRLRNRIVSTAHGTYMPDQGLQTAQIAAYQRQRARGGVGLIILEATSTHPSGIGAPQFATAHTDECIPGYQMVIDAVHAHGVPVFVQLYHPGRDDIAGSTADATIAPSFSASSVLCETNQLMPRAMTRAMIRDVIDSYGLAAQRLIHAGADGIEISAHHGHLISQFLDPRLNHRSDEYGGSFENRFRILSEIIASVRDSIGERPVVGVRLTSGEGSAAGITSEESIEAAMATDRLDGVDFLHITPGSTATFDGMSQVVPPMAFAAGYAAELFRRFRAVLRKPLFATGRINDPSIAERLLQSGCADCIGMTRALICDPDMPAKAARGHAEDIRFCIACNQACIGHDRRGGFVSCIQNPEAGRELQVTREATVTTGKRKVVVVGGGPAGMKAAVVAAERGHSVTLLEREARLGGRAILASNLPGRAEFGGLVTNLQRELHRLGVRVVLKQQATVDVITAERPSAIVLATGAVPYKPDIPGEDELQVVHAWDVAAGQSRVGPSVVIADATMDWTALGVAELLAREGCSVRMFSLGFASGQNTPFGVRSLGLGVLHSLRVSMTPLMRLAGCGERTVYFQHAANQEVVSVENVDTLVLSFGGVPDVGLEGLLEGGATEYHVVGDCLAPRTAEEAILEGYNVARQL